MALRLRGATSGYIELKAPASAGDNTLTLPVNNGSANQLLKTDGSGNLSWTDDNSGVSLSGSTNNTIATVTGANALQGEANLTFNGSLLELTGDLAVSTTNRIYFGNSDVSWIKGEHGGSGYLEFGVNTIHMILNRAGFLGIGNTNPGELLSLRHATSNTVLDFECLAANDGTTGNIIKFRGKGANGVSYHASQIKGITENAGNNAGFLSFWTNSAGTVAEKMRINSNGNVGIGTVSPGQKLGVSGNIRFEAADPTLEFNNGGAMIYARVANTLQFASGGGPASPTEKMRIDANGNVQIGATSYGGGGANPILYLKSNSGRQFKIHNPDAGTVGLQLTNSGSGEGEDAGLFIAMLSGGGGYIKNNVNNADFMDWYSQVSGSQKYILKVYNDGKHGIQSNTDCLMCSTSQDGTGSNYFLRGSKNSTAPGGGNDVAWIYEDGDMYNANGTFSQSSDVALKENIVDANSQWADIKGLKFRNFNFKASTGLDTHKQLGLVAQEVEPISPGLIKDRDKIVKTTNSDGTVTETTDGTTKSIKLSILYMKGMKALQEAMSRIETLEAKVAALESA